MSDQQGGLNAPVQQPVSQGTTPAPGGKTQSFGTRPAKNAATPSESESYFHSYKHDDGEEIKFKTPDDLSRYLRDGTLRHKDYTKKTQEVAELRKQIEKERETSRTESTAAMKAYGQWKDVDEWLRKNPRVVEIIRREGGPIAQQLEQAQAQQSSVPDEVKTQLEELRQWKEAQEAEAKIQSHYEALKGQYEDFDEESVAELYRQLDEAPEGEETRALLELLYYASKGKNGTAVRPPVMPGVRVPSAPSKMPFDDKTRDKFAAAKKAMRAR